MVVTSVVDMAATDYLEMKFKSTSETPTLTLYNINISINRISQ
jgi:hypothetical protein